MSHKQAGPDALLADNQYWIDCCCLNWWLKTRSWALKWASNGAQLIHTTQVNTADDNLELDLWESQATFWREDLELSSTKSCKISQMQCIISLRPFYNDAGGWYSERMFLLLILLVKLMWPQFDLNSCIGDCTSASVLVVFNREDKDSEQSWGELLFQFFFLFSILVYFPFLKQIFFLPLSPSIYISL